MITHKKKKKYKNKLIQDENSIFKYLYLISEIRGQ